MTLILDSLFLRRPRLNYVSPAICLNTVVIPQSGASGQVFTYSSGSSQGEVVIDSGSSGGDGGGDDETPPPDLDCPEAVVAPPIDVDLAQPGPMAVSTSNNLLWVGDYFIGDDRSSRVAYVDLLTNLQLGSVDIGADDPDDPGVWQIIYDSKNDQIVVTRKNGGIVFIDAATKTVLSTFDPPSNFGFQSLATDPITGKIFASGIDPATLYVIDGATRTVIATAAALGGLTWCPNLGKLFVPNAPGGDTSQPLYRLFDPVTLTYSNSTLLATPAIFESEAWYVEQTGQVVMSTERNVPSHPLIIDIVSGVIVGELSADNQNASLSNEIYRIESGVVSASCAGRFFIINTGYSAETLHLNEFNPDDSYSLAYRDLDTGGRNITYSRRTNLVYMSTVGGQIVSYSASHLGEWVRSVEKSATVTVTCDDASESSAGYTVPAGQYRAFLNDPTGAEIAAEQTNLDNQAQAAATAAATLDAQNACPPTETWTCPNQPEPQGGIDIPSAKAANGGSPAYTDYGPIGLLECNPDDMSVGANQTFILTLPFNWQFQPGVGTVEFLPSLDVSTVSILVEADKVTLTVGVTGNTNIDRIIIRGLKVQEIDNSFAGGADNGYLLNLSDNPGTLTFNGIWQDLTTFGYLNAI